MMIDRYTVENAGDRATTYRYSVESGRRRVVFSFQRLKKGRLVRLTPTRIRYVVAKEKATCGWCLPAHNRKRQQLKLRSNEETTNNPPGLLALFGFFYGKHEIGDDRIESNIACYYKGSMQLRHQSDTSGLSNIW